MHGDDWKALGVNLRSGILWILVPAWRNADRRFLAVRCTTYQRLVARSGYPRLPGKGVGCVDFPRKIRPLGERAEVIAPIAAPSVRIRIGAWRTLISRTDLSRFVR